MTSKNTKIRNIIIVGDEAFVCEFEMTRRSILNVIEMSLTKLGTWCDAVGYR